MPETDCSILVARKVYRAGERISLTAPPMATHGSAHALTVKKTTDPVACWSDTTTPQLGTLNRAGPYSPRDIRSFVVLHCNNFIMITVLYNEINKTGHEMLIRNKDLD